MGGVGGKERRDREEKRRTAAHVSGCVSANTSMLAKSAGANTYTLKYTNCSSHSSSKKRPLSSLLSEIKTSPAARGSY